MSRTWLYSDPHFFHQGVCRFTDNEGEPLRPWDDAVEMTEELIRRYNEVVNDEDRVYILGDVAFNRRALNSSVPLLNGRKVLVKGNHDVDKLSYYSQYFDDVRSYVVKKGFVLSHIPLHPSCLSRWGLNIHGHLHSNYILDDEGNRDSRYENVCVEKTDYKPILLDVVLERNGLK